MLELDFLYLLSWAEGEGPGPIAVVSGGGPEPLWRATFWVWGVEGPETMQQDEGRPGSRQLVWPQAARPSWGARGQWAVIRPYGAFKNTLQHLMWAL